MRRRPALKRARDLAWLSSFSVCQRESLHPNFVIQVGGMKEKGLSNRYCYVYSELEMKVCGRHCQLDFRRYCGSAT